METKYTFRNELKCASPEQIIRQWLEMHGLMNVDNLCCKTGFPESAIRPALEAMLTRGEIERLRPLEYEGDDMDFFRMRVQQRQTMAGTSRGRWFSGLKRTARMLFDETEDNIEHHHANNILTPS